MNERKKALGIGFVLELPKLIFLAGEAYYRAGDVDNALKYINMLRRNCAIKGKEKEMEISAPTYQLILFWMNVPVN